MDCAKLSSRIYKNNVPQLSKMSELPIDSLES